MSSTTTKSAIGGSDIEWYDGGNETFTRLTSTGGNLTLYKIGIEVDVAAAYGAGVASYAALSTAVQTIGSSQRTLVLKSGTWSITSDLTIPSNITLKVPQGAILAIATTKTLTINGPIEAGTYKIFSYTGTGKVVFGKGYVKDFYPAWWGVVGNGTTDDTNFIQYAINAAGSASGGRVILFPGDYRITTSLTIGDGAADTWSTYHGVSLVGTAPAMHLNTGSPSKSPVNIVTDFASAIPAIVINGPIMGWGIKNLSIDCEDDANAHGLKVIEGQGGCCEDLLIVFCSNISILMTTNASVTWKTNCTQNSFDRTFIYLDSAAATAIGILLNGDVGGGNSCFNTFRKTHITPTNAGHTGVLYQYCDSNSFIDLDINPIDAADPSTPLCIASQYTYDIKAGFPNGNVVLNYEPYQNTTEIHSTPAVGLAHNYVFLSTSNAAQPVSLAGVTFQTNVRDKARMYLDAAQSIGAVGGTIALDTSSYDTNNLNDTTAHTITVKVAGYYRLYGQIGVASFAGASILAGGIGVNATPISERSVSNNGVVAGVSVGATVWMAKDDYAYLYASIGGGATAVTVGSANTFLELEGPL